MGSRLNGLHPVGAGVEGDLPGIERSAVALHPHTAVLHVEEGLSAAGFHGNFVGLQFICASLDVDAAAVLHDIGILAAERKHGSNAGKFQEIEGPASARPILEGLGVDAERTGHILRIIGSHHSAREIDTPEFRIIWDADRLANIPEELAGKTPEDGRALVQKVYRTPTGRAMGEAAVARFLGASA